MPVPAITRVFDGFSAVVTLRRLASGGNGGFGRPPSRHIVVCGAGIRAVRFLAEELLLHQLVEGGGARRAFDTAEAMGLLGGQTEAWHLEKFCAESIDRSMHMAS
jgi:hypothetical protein